MGDNPENGEADDRTVPSRSDSGGTIASQDRSREAERIGIFARTLRAVQEALPSTSRALNIFTSYGPEEPGASDKQLAVNTQSIQQDSEDSACLEAQAHFDDSDMECQCSQPDSINWEMGLDDLPLNVIYKVLYHLPPWDAARACELNSTFFALGNSVIRTRFNRLLLELDNELGILKKEIQESDLSQEGVIQRVYLFRSYSTCEFLRSEMFSTRAIGRLLLFSKDRAFNFGRLLQEYSTLFQRAVDRSLPPWQVNDWLTLSIWKLARGFMSEKGFHGRDPRSPLGTRFLDLADALIDRQLSQRSDYIIDGSGNIEVIADITYFIHPQYVARPPFFPDLSPPIENEKSKPDAEDVKIIMEYILNFVKVNNRIILREEQYNRELEYTNRVGSNGNGRLRWLTKEPRDYSMPPGPPIELTGGGDKPLIVSVRAASLEYPFDPPRNIKRRCGWG